MGLDITVWPLQPCARHCARHIQNYARHAVRVLEMLAIVMTYLFVPQYVLSEKC